MADPTSSKTSSRAAFEADLQRRRAELEEKRKRITQPNGGKPDNGPDSGSGESGPTPQGNNGNSGQGGSPDEGQNPPPPPPVEEYDETVNFESNAYNLGKMAEPKKEPPAKQHSGAAKAPERKKDGYKPGSSSNFLQACYNEIVVASYAGIIDLGVDLTLDVFDWILFAPLSSGKSTKKKADNKEKTIFDYADEMIADNTEKGKRLVQSALIHHKEILDNIECAQNGQTPKWRVWQGQEPQCFKHLLEIKTKADADPNSPEAALWKEFKEDLPHKAIEHIARLTDMANFAVHHAALSTEMTDIEPLPVEITKAYKEMEKIIENKELNDAEVKAGLSEKIRDIRQYTATNTPINEEINKSLNKFSDLLMIPNCDRKAMAEKLLDLEDIHPIKLKLQESAAAFGKEIIQNINSIDKAYASDSERAEAEKGKYLEKINESQKEAASRKKKDLKSIWLMRNFGIKNFGNTKANAQNAINYAENTIRYVRVPQNVQSAGGDQNQQSKKQIQSDMDIKNFINYLGLKR